VPTIVTPRSVPLEMQSVQYVVNNFHHSDAGAWCEKVVGLDDAVLEKVAQTDRLFLAQARARPPRCTATAEPRRPVRYRRT
jgi:hypothetical protein